MPLKVNTQLGNFKILSGIAKGGMGEVYLAHDSRLDRKVALKVLQPEFTANKELLKRFEQEARAVSALNHPYILTIFEFGESDDGTHFIATEFVEGKTLNEHAVANSIDLKEVLEISIQVASALSAAHEADIIHRDIKPENIMLRPDGYVKVLDFGLAKLKQAPPSDVEPEAQTQALLNTSPGSVMGTAAYMSPEQARGLEVDARTDIWSLGVVIYELITRRKPFFGQTNTDTIVSVIHNEPAPMTQFASELPAELIWIVSKTLSKKLDGRYQTAKELHADLVKIKQHLEFASEADRSAPPESFSKKPGQDAPTMIYERTPTSAQKVGVTQASAQRPSILAFVINRFRNQKLISVIGLLLLISLVSAAAYLSIMSFSGGNQIESVAVLPFVNGGNDQELAYISDGISESLIDRLSELKQLKVIARNSSFKFRGKDPDIGNIASQLGVRAIVSGTVTQRGDDLSVRVEIIDAIENKQIWGKRFNRKADDVISIENEIALAVSEKLSLNLSDDQEKRLVTGGTENPEAYRQYLNGLVELRGPDDVRGKALSYFESAVELDPNFALAHAEIASIYYMRAGGSGNPEVLMPKAKAAALKAASIDDNLAQAHLALAQVKEFEFDWKGAEREYVRSVELNPNLESSRYIYAFYLSVMNRNPEALEQIEQAKLRDPINKRMTLLWEGNILSAARDFDGAIRRYDEAEKIDPNARADHFSLGYAYAGRSSYSEAIESYKKSIDILGGPEKYSQPLVYLGAVYAKVPGKKEEARAILKKVEASDEYVSPAIIAVLYAALGENDKAIKALETAYSKRDLLLRFIGVGYEYDGLRQDPRFKNLLKRIGLNER